MVTVIVILIVLALIAAIAFLVSDKVKDLFHLGGKNSSTSYGTHREPSRIQKKILTDGGKDSDCRVPQPKKPSHERKELE